MTKLHRVNYEHAKKNLNLHPETLSRQAHQKLQHKKSNFCKEWSKISHLDTGTFFRQVQWFFKSWFIIILHHKAENLLHHHQSLTGIWCFKRWLANVKFPQHFSNFVRVLTNQHNQAKRSNTKKGPTPPQNPTTFFSFSDFKKINMHLVSLSLAVEGILHVLA